jgi:hypothetical protein
MVYKAKETTLDPNKIQIQLPPSETTAPDSLAPGAPSTTEEQQKEEEKDSQSLEDAFKAAPAPSVPPATK